MNNKIIFLFLKIYFMNLFINIIVRILIMNKIQKVHFLGINGSGIAGVACLAKQNGFDVDGCDAVKEGNYTQQLRDLNIDIQVGHSIEHLKDKDMLVVSAAIFFKDNYKQIAEIVEAEKLGIPIIKWQKFLNDYLVNDKYFIAVCGTHGKTSTTTFVANLLDDVELKPSCIIGGTNPRWNTSFKFNNGKYFVCEADEYGHNFHCYNPNCIILNNIEMEHPEFFKNYSEYKDNFKDFIKNIKQNGLLIFSIDDSNTLEIVLELKEFLLKNNITVIGFTVKENNTKEDFIAVKRIKVLNNNSFIYNDKQYNLKNIQGSHNIHNIINVLLLGEYLKIDIDAVKNSIENAILPKRRMEVVFENKKVNVFDDYAHHHSQIYYNLSTLKNSLKNNEKIIAILEPHLISRFKNNPKEHLDYMEIADYSIITKFYKSREADLPDLDMHDYLKRRKTEYIEDFDAVVNRVNEIVKGDDKTFYYIVVMGAGLSYKLTEKIKENFIKNI